MSGMWSIVQYVVGPAPIGATVPERMLMMAAGVTGVLIALRSVIGMIERIGKGGWS